MPQVLSHLNFGVLRLDHDKSISACAALAKYIPNTLQAPRVKPKGSKIDVIFRQNLETEHSSLQGLPNPNNTLPMSLISNYLTRQRR